MIDSNNILIQELNSIDEKIHITLCKKQYYILKTDGNNIWSQSYLM